MNNILNKFKKINTEPWNISFWERIEILKKEDGKNKVVYIYEKSDSSTFRYRVYNMCQTLAYSSEWAGSYFFENELHLLDDYLDRVNVIILVRVRWSIVMDEFVNKIKKGGALVGFDTDDLVFDVEKIPLIMNTLNIDFSNSENYSYWFSYVSRLWLMGKKCDFFVSTNKFLCDKIENSFNKPTFIVNNFLNKEQIKISSELFSRKIKESNQKNKKFRIGYFSGTPSHINDFKKISGEMVQLLEDFPNIILDVAGYMEFPDNMKDLAKKGRIIHSPFVDFITLQKKISEVDINIVPLVENEFTNCKSELKFFEAAIVGSITCATPTYVFKENIVDGESGYLCGDGVWYKVIKSIYSTRRNTELIVKANEYCLNKYSPKNQLENVEYMLNSVKRK
jgi:glycosyltransferase involved in cell wall biosynthesis